MFDLSSILVGKDVDLYFLRPTLSCSMEIHYISEKSFEDVQRHFKGMCKFSTS